MKKIDVIQTFFERVWNNGDSDAIFELFVPGQQGRHTAGGLMKDEKLGPEEFQQFQQALLNLVDNFNLSVDRYIEQGDWISVQCTATGIGKRSGMKVTAAGSAWARITDGKIREAENHFDFLNFFEGLGFLPENTLMTCLSGQLVMPRTVA